MKILYIDCSFGFDALMLLGALADAGADFNEVASALQADYPDITLEIKDVVRNHLECKLARIFPDRTALGDALAPKAAEEAIRSLDIDYIITSAVPVSDGTDGGVISMLERAGIEMFPTDTDGVCADEAGFLAFLANDSGTKPDMDVLAVGYGASQKDGLVMATIGYMNTDEINFNTEEMEQFL